MICRLNIFLIFLVIIVFFSFNNVNSQAVCDPPVIQHVIDLSSDPETSYTTDYIDRNNGSCCGNSNEKCTEFIVTLHPDAIGLFVTIIEGSEPSGSMNWSIDCGPGQSVSSAVCLGGGTHNLVYCKPGGDMQRYNFQSISAPSIDQGHVATEFCPDIIRPTGLDYSSITVTAIDGEFGNDTASLNLYNSFVTPVPAEEIFSVVCISDCPLWVNYVVTGNVYVPAGSESCFAGYDLSFTDTVSVNFYDAVSYDLDPDDLRYCEYDSGLNVIVNPIGGLSPYWYEWYDDYGGSSGSGNLLYTSDTSENNYFTTGNGHHSVVIYDQLYPICAPTTVDFDVERISIPSVNLGTDTSTCYYNTPITLDAGAGYNSYLWNTGSSNQTISVDTSGIYSVTVTEAAFNCSRIDDISINIFVDPLTELDTSQFSCNSLLPYTIDAGDNMASYNWSTLETSQTIEVLTSGIYSVTVTDLNGCSSERDIDFNVIPDPNVNLGPDITLCVDDLPYTIDAGTGFVSYIWNTLDTTQTIDINSSGNYSVTVTDISTCQDYDDIFITVNPNPTINCPLDTVIILCNQPFPSAANNITEFIALGGNTNGTSISFVDSPPINVGCFETIQRTYEAFLGTCSSTCIQNISRKVDIMPPTASNPADIFVGCPADVPIPDVNQISDETDNCIDPISVSWISDISDNLYCPETIIRTYNVSDVCGNNINVFQNIIIEPLNLPVVPADGSSTVECLAEAVAPTTPEVEDQCGNNITANLVSIVDTPNPITCEGTRVYTYSYTDCGSNTSNWHYTYTIDISSLPVVPADGSSTVECLAEAIAPTTPEVVDACDNTITPVLENIIDDPNPLFCGGTRIYEYSFTDCNGNASMWSYTYMVNDPVIDIVCPEDQIFNIDSSNNYTISELVAQSNCEGSFNVSWNITGATSRSGTGNDASGIFNEGISVINWTIVDFCGNIYNCQTEVEVFFPAVICPNSYEMCEDTSLQILSNTGEFPEGGVFSGSGVTFDEGIYYFNSAGHAGINTITYTWTNENSYSRSCTYNITVHELPVFTTTVIQHPLCNGDSNGIVNVNINNSASMYNINWELGNIYTSNVNYFISSLSSGMYSITVTDNYGCSYENFALLTDPPVLSGNISVTSDYNGSDISCYGALDGEATVYPIGGTPPYSYLWSLSAGSQNTQTAINLGPGLHFVTIHDAHNCSYELSIGLNEPDPINIDIQLNNNVSCFGLSDGSATATATGGTSPYSYLWNDPLNTNNRFANSLPAGTWTVTVNDINNCSFSKEITILQPALLDINFSSVNHISCFNGSDGRLSAYPVGGTPDYNILWSNGSTDYSLFNVIAGTYSVTVVDAHGCTATESYNLNQPDPLVLEVSSQSVICGSNLGSASISIMGGTPDYSVIWSNDSSELFEANLNSQEYSVTVTDSHGCQNEISFTIPVEGGLNVGIIEQSSISCYGKNDGALLATVTNGSLNYSYEWSNADTNQLLTNVSAGQYTVSVEDSWGCSGSATYIINEPSQIFIEVFSENVKCKNGNDGYLIASATGGIGPYTYQWFDGPSSQTYSNLSAGEYYINVSDSRGCNTIDTAFINEPDRSLDVLITTKDISCFGLNDGSISAHAVGGTPGYYYKWISNSFASIDSLLFNLSEGFYYLTVTDNNHCIVDTFVSIGQPSQIEYILTVKNPSCIDNDDGAISLNIIGGVPPYNVFVNQYLYEFYQSIDNLTEGVYEVNISDSNGCVLNIGKIILKDNPVDCIIIPNAFTPNNDGINDTWVIQNIEAYPDANIKVYNRWGQLLWEGDSSMQWNGFFNGNILPIGSYLYFIEFGKDINAKVGIVTIMY